jgi:hypothetical protein
MDPDFSAVDLLCKDPLRLFQLLVRNISTSAATNINMAISNATDLDKVHPCKWQMLRENSRPGYGTSVIWEGLYHPVNCRLSAS